MKKVLIFFIYFIPGLIGNDKSLGQQFAAGEFSTIKPSQVIIENYTLINLSKEIIDDVLANRFDVNNPYTYLQIINDGSLNKYHILFQTGFTGKIIFLSYSNNLTGLFNKANKPMFMFTRCLKDVNNHLSSVQVIDAAVKCIVERLNYCNEN